jgi:fumarate reductase subunit C
MSAANARTPRTPTSPARKPAGFPLGWYRYRNYTVFAATCIPMAVAAFELLHGVSALGKGEEAWNAWRASLATGPVRALNVVCLLFALYFSFRFGWVGRKIAAGRIGPVPKPPLPMAILGIAPLGGFVTLWLVLFIVLGGFI